MRRRTISTLSTSTQSFLFHVFVLVILVCNGMAQSSSSDVDGYTPEGLKTGRPIGSFQLSNFENINYFNGNLNFTLPLLNVSGRGNASYSIPLKIEAKWSVHTNRPELRPQYLTQIPVFSELSSLAPGFSAGTITERYGYAGSIPEGCDQYGSRGDVIPTLTRLTFITPDGTETELRDVLLNGNQSGVHWQYNNCIFSINKPNRGKHFISSDGSGITFISDYDILDQVDVDPKGANGYLLMPNGTRYRIEKGKVRWIRDQNGNKITFNYVDVNPYWEQLISVRDSLNRQIMFSYASSTGQDHDLITYKGFGGAQRNIIIRYKPLSQVLRSGSVQTRNQLFPGLPGSAPIKDQIFDPSVQASVELPDGRSYQFKYNAYGELSRIELPTGGAIEYDYAAGLIGGAESGTYTRGEPEKHVYRRVIERRVYLNKNSSVYTYKTSISRPESYAGGISYNNLGYVDVETRDYSNGLLGKEIHYYYGSALVSPEEDQQVKYNPWKTGREWKTDIFAGDGTTVLQRIEQTWQQPAGDGKWPLTQAETNDNTRSNNPQIAQTITTLVDSNQLSMQNFAYDEFFNRTDVYEYAYGLGGAGSLLRRTHTDYLRTNPNQGNVDYATDSNIHIRNLPLQQTVYDAGSNQKSLTIYEYDNYSSTSDRAPLMDRPNISGHDSLYTSGYQTRGNVTAVSRWLDNPSGYITTYQQFDIAGNVVKTIDGRGNSTTIDYSDRFGIPDSEARANSGPAELNGQISYAFSTKVTNTLGHDAYIQYDYYLGKPVNVEDANGLVSSTSYNDPLDRPTQGVRAVNDSANKSQTSITYDDTNRIITTTSDLLAYGDNKLKSEVFYDGLGRTYESRSYENSTSYIRSLTEYDALGRPSRASNPHRSGDALMWTTSSYDALGRVIDVKTPDDAHVITQYSGNQVTVTDQAGKTRRSETDALGRLIKIIEDPAVSNYETSYSYDVLGNLRQVTQGGQTRTFVYDSLARLISATNPESGTINYSYDSNGNLIEKTDARGVITTMSYDALNRVRLKSYSGNSPDATTIANATVPIYYYYDDYSTLPIGAPSWTGTPSKGKLIGIIYGAGTEGTYYKYDAVGNVLISYQRQGTSNFQTAYKYNIAGNVTVETRSNKRKSFPYYDQTGRLTGLQTQTYPYLGLNNIVSNIQYTAFGALQQETYGNNLLHSLDYNVRQQPMRIWLGQVATPGSVMRLDYIFGLAQEVNVEDPSILQQYNNGNVGRIKQYINGVLQQSQTFQYDGLNRLKYAIEHTNGDYNDASRSWYQTFDYDRYGNRGINITGSSDNTDANNSALQLSDFSSVNNQITRSGYTYDASGNLITEPGKSYTYDAENRIVTAVVQGGATSQYIYDGNGRRVKTVVNGIGTRFEYGVGGELLTERDDNGNSVKEYLYRNGEMVATAETGGTVYKFATSDHLGSPRVWTDWNGNIIAAGRHDYLPFGEELFAGVGNRTVAQGYASNTQADGQRKQFTSKERDAETNLDYFGARYYSSTHGRFTSPDEFTGGPDELFVFAAAASANPTFYADIRNPQSLNKYHYTYNNPLKYIDPNGHCSVPAGLKSGSTGICMEAFIAAPRIEGIGLGDNRTFSGDNPDLTSRLRIDMIVTPNSNGGANINWTTTSGVSHIDFPNGNVEGTAFGLGLKGSASATVSNAVTDKNGTTTFDVSATAKNGFQTLPIVGGLAPAGTIDMKLNVSVSANGTVGIGDSSSAKMYPSYAMYSYRVDNKGNVTTTLIFKREERKPEDLTKKMEPIK